MKVIVTGASRGIGRGIATYLAMDGFSVGLIARNAETLGDICAGIREQGGTAFGAACDLRDPAMTAAAIDQLGDDLGGIDALINNAGVVLRKSVWDLSVEEWRAMVDTNLSANDSIVLMRSGSPTHAFDMEQRLAGLTFTPGSGDITVTTPPNSNIAPPGYYMLFLVSQAGVPSEAVWIHLQ